MTQEKGLFTPVSVSSEELEVDPDILYGKILQICKLEMNVNKYEEHAICHLKNVESCVEASLADKERKFFIDSFHFLRETNGIKIALLLRDLLGEIDGENLLEGLETFSNFKEDLLRGCEPSARMDLKIEMQEDSFAQDYFLSFYPVYLHISDSEKIQEIEEVVAYIEDRYIVPL
jgi:hypothetical protein